MLGHLFSKLLFLKPDSIGLGIALGSKNQKQNYEFQLHKKITSPCTLFGIMDLNEVLKLEEIPDYVV